jgi:hypothetical protein
MNEQITIQQAEDHGYTVDTTCYPHIAYKGPRFNPTEIARVYTAIEAYMLAQQDAGKVDGCRFCGMSSTDPCPECPDPVAAQPASGDDLNLIERLREYAANNGYSHTDYADTMLAAANALERVQPAKATAGGSNFESWYAQQDISGVTSIKQVSRYAYAAGMSETTAKQPDPAMADKEWRTQLRVILGLGGVDEETMLNVMLHARQRVQPAPAMVGDDRAAFETWMAGGFPDHSLKKAGGMYLNYMTVRYWIVWHSAAEHVRSENRKPVQPASGGDVK